MKHISIDGAREIERERGVKNINRMLRHDTEMGRKTSEKKISKVGLLAQKKPLSIKLISSERTKSQSILHEYHSPHLLITISEIEKAKTCSGLRICIFGWLI